MTANARPLHSFNGVWDVYQVSFICFRLISSFSPLFHHRFCFCFGSLPFAYAFPIDLRHHQAAQRSQLHQQTTVGHTRTTAQSLQLVRKSHQWRKTIDQERGGYHQKKAAVASFGKCLANEGLDQRRGGACPIFSYFFSSCFFFFFFLFFLNCFLSYPMSKVKKDWSGMVAQKKQRRLERSSWCDYNCLVS